MKTTRTNRMWACFIVGSAIAIGLSVAVAGNGWAAEQNPAGKGGPRFELVDLGPGAIQIRDQKGRYAVGLSVDSQAYLLELDAEGRFYRDDNGDGSNDLARRLAGFYSDGSGAGPRKVNRRGVVVGESSAPGATALPARWVNGRLTVTVDWATAIHNEIWNDPETRAADFSPRVNQVNDAGRMLVESGEFTSNFLLNRSNWCATVSGGPRVSHLVDPPVWFGNGQFDRPECIALLMNNAGTVVAVYRFNATINTDYKDPDTTGDWGIFVFNGQGTLKGLDGQPALISGDINTGPTGVHDMNDRSQISGNWRDSTGVNHAVIWEPDGSVTELATTEQLARSINNLGEVLIGRSLYLPNPNYGLPAGTHVLTDLGLSLSSSEMPVSINDCGIVTVNTTTSFFRGSKVYRPIGSTCAPPESGDVVVQLDSTQFIATEDEIQVQNATVSLYRQAGYLREQRSGESDQDYQTYLESQRANRDPVDTKVIGPTDLGRVVFRGVPLIEPVEVGQSSTLNWLYYTVEVSRASSEEFDFDAGMGTKTVHFVSDSLANVSPSDTLPPAEYDLALTPVDGIQRKKDLIDQLSVLAPVNYAPIENLMLVGVNDLETAGSITAEQRDWLRRAILAERVTRDGARFANEALTYMLRGLAALAGEVFDAATSFTRQDIVREKKRLQRIKDNQNVVNPFFDQQGFDGGQYIQRLNVQKIITDGQDAKALKKIFGLLKPLMAAAAEATGMPPQQAKDITDNLMRALKLMFNFIEERTLGGALKDELKTIVEEAVKGTQPFLFDNAALFGFQSPIDVSYTESTKGGLQHALDRFSDWNQSDPAAYAADREAISNIEFQLGDEAAFVISLANALLEVAQAFDTAQKIFELGGKVFKQFEAAAKFSEVMKLAGNGGAFVVPAIFVYVNAPDQVNEAAYRAFGATPPEVQR